MTSSFSFLSRAVVPLVALTAGLLGTARCQGDPIAMLPKPYAPLMAVVSGGCLGPFDDSQIRHIAETWKMVNSHAGMLNHRDPEEGMMPFWAGRSCGTDASGATNLERIKALRPDFIFSNYRNGSYVSQFSPDEAAEVESRLPLAISVWNTGSVVLRAVGPAETTLLISRNSPPAGLGQKKNRAESYPFKASTTGAEHSRTTKEYVAWIRLGDEILRIDSVRATDAGIEMRVRRGVWGTTASPHAEGAAVFQPVYIGRTTGIAAADTGLGGRPDDPSRQPGLRYALMTFDPAMHRWLGEKAKATFDEGYDVCWLDVSVSTWYNNANAFGDEVRPWNMRKSEPLTQADYREWQQLKTDALQAMLPEGKFWINNLKGDSYFERGRDRMQLSGENGHRPVDGGSMEMYANHRGNELAWRKTLNMTLDMVANRFRAVAWSKGRKDSAYRRFSYATYLLAYEPGAEIYFAPGEGTGLLGKPGDLFYFDLGAPTESFRTAADAERVEASGVYERDFTKAKVLVNPGSQPKEISLETPHVDSATGKIVRSLTLAGNTAAILFLPQE